MSYIELMNEFWRKDELKSFSPKETKLYFLLLHYAFTEAKSDTFELPTRYFECHLLITRKCFCELRNSLKESGLISFEDGSRQSPAHYTIIYP